jgi:MFS family permease
MIMMNLIMWLFISYGMSNIMVFGSIFNTPREWITRKSEWFGKLVNCMMCLPFYVGIFMSLVLGGLTNKFFPCPWYMCLFFDAVLTSGLVYSFNVLVEKLEK